MSSTKEFLKVVSLIERLSLIRFADKSGIKRLEEAIDFANQIKEVDTSGVIPMISPIESNCVHLRNDINSETKREDITKNANQLIEEYFVVPFAHKEYIQSINSDFDNKDNELNLNHIKDK
jgi:aspartyl-tRNA(Asn)/glutamyl-tRNA(Gln) amidotransferase subunit C